MKILKLKEQKDGSALLTVGYTKEEAIFIKKYYNKKKVTAKLLQRFVCEGLENYLKEKK
jgi:hypothetical protein